MVDFVTVTTTVSFLTLRFQEDREFRKWIFTMRKDERKAMGILYILIRFNVSPEPTTSCYRVGRVVCVGQCVT